MKNKQEGKLGIALVGLGTYATNQLAPALAQTQHCYLAAIVTGTPSKAAAWKATYNIPDKNIYNYENFDNIINNADIDIVYIVLPNYLHAEYTIRAALAGKHVICEKPMAITVEDCDVMIAACKKAGKQLSIGYRLHFDPYHLEMIKFGKDLNTGMIKNIKSNFSQTSQKGEWRLDKKIAGGGPLMDLGIYCLQAVMYTTGMQPIAVTAQSYPISDFEKFIDIEETISWQMEMPNGIIANCKTSYSETQNNFRVEKEKAWFELSPAFSYTGLQATHTESNIKFPSFSQQEKQMDAFALSIINNEQTIVPGEMGRRDVKIIEAIYQAMETGQRIEINFN